MCGGVFCVTGGFQSSQGSGNLGDAVSEEEAMEWFIEEIANYTPRNAGLKTEIHEVLVSMMEVVVEPQNFVDGTEACALMLSAGRTRGWDV